MTIYDSMFISSRRRDAYYEMVEDLIPRAVTEVLEELEAYDFDVSVETVQKFNSPAIQINVDIDFKHENFFVVFDSTYGTYAVGQDSLTGNFNSKPFNSSLDTINHLKERIKQVVIA